MSKGIPNNTGNYLLEPELRGLSPEDIAELERWEKEQDEESEGGLEIIDFNRGFYETLLGANSELLKKLDLETQYAECLDDLKHYGFLDENARPKEGDARLPEIEEIMISFLPEELEIASNFQKPTLVLVPENSFDAKLAAIDSHKEELQRDTNKNASYDLSKEDNLSEKIIGWRTVIVDGASEIQAYSGDDFDLDLDERFRNRKRNRKEFEKGIDRNIYAMLMMQSIKKASPIDQLTYTILDDDKAVGNTYLPTANYSIYNNQVNFSRNETRDIDSFCRFRSSVGGGVLIN